MVVSYRKVLRFRCVMAKVQKDLISNYMDDQTLTRGHSLLSVQSRRAAAATISAIRFKVSLERLHW